MSRDDIPATRPCQVLRRLFSQDKTMREITISNYSNTCTHFDAKNDIVVMIEALCMFTNNVNTIKITEDALPDSLWTSLINFIHSSSSLVRVEIICQDAFPKFALEMLSQRLHHEIDDGNYNSIYIGIIRFNALYPTRDDRQTVIELKKTH